MNKVYLVAFDIAPPRTSTGLTGLNFNNTITTPGLWGSNPEPIFNTQIAHSVIENSPDVKDWWHYIKSIYLVVSEKSAEELYAELGRASQGKSFLIMEVKTDSDARQGWLPKDAWEWLKKYEPKPRKVKIVKKKKPPS